MNATYDPAGFVCPEWAQGHWSSRESTIEKCTDGRYAVVCHETQVTVYKGTKSDCQNFLQIEG